MDGLSRKWNHTKNINSKITHLLRRILPLSGFKVWFLFLFLSPSLCVCHSFACNGRVKFSFSGSLSPRSQWYFKYMITNAGIHTKMSTKLILYWFQSTYILFIFDLISLNMLTFHPPSRWFCNFHRHFCGSLHMARCILSIFLSRSPSSFPLSIFSVIWFVVSLLRSNLHHST